MNTKTRLATTERRRLTPTEKENFEDLVITEKAQKTETEQFYPLAQSGPGDSDQVKRVKRTLASGEIEPLSEHEEAAYEKRAEEIKEYLILHMVPQSHIGLRPQKDGSQSLEFIKAKNSMAKEELSPEFTKAAQEYKNIMRQLGRSDEANLEYIRPRRR